MADARPLLRSLRKPILPIASSRHRSVQPALRPSRGRLRRNRTRTSTRIASTEGIVSPRGGETRQPGRKDGRRTRTAPAHREFAEIRAYSGGLDSSAAYTGRRDSSRWRPFPWFQPRLWRMPPEPFRWMGYHVYTKLTGRSPRKPH